ncbi:MAG: hypothetical protein JRJ86_23895 [Deltaproteobacteria bacterium]|nr:hypothetical protein [Deltaproteobacteria bacterium]
MLKLNLDKLTYDPQWHDFGEARLLIRPMPMSKADIVMSDSGMVIKGDNQCQVFKYCLVNWENVVGADGKELPCNDEVKQKIFDFNLAGIPAFVLAKDREFRQAKAEQEKN